MASDANLLGKPIHQMLIGFPFGLFASAIVFDLLTIWYGNPKWTGIAYWLIAAGILSGLLASVFCFLDWTGIPAGTGANVVGMCHSVGNILVIGFFTASWMLRRATPDNPETLAYVFSFFGAGLVIATVWLGGRLVNRLGMGPRNGTPLNSSDSLAGGMHSSHPRS